ncbi:MAG TPA: hypothetical protein VMQ44_01780 [Candidatus Saccharimonadales bacterium]|nr:hypothetical protein [Candidatus Saccharimonadales bacterium]
MNEMEGSIPEETVDFIAPATGEAGVEQEKAELTAAEMLDFVRENYSERNFMEILTKPVAIF